MRRLRLGFVGIVALTAAGVTLAYHFLIGFDGVFTVYSSNNCGDVRITVLFNMQRHSFDFERGDEIGYAVTVTTPGRQPVSIYAPSGPPGWYQHWRGGALSDFDPLPPETIGLPVRRFEVPDRTYNRDSWPAESPPLMNIFLDPSRFSRAEFDAIADCLQTDRAAMNKALAGLGSRYPGRDKHYYFPLRVGGVVYGLPSYGDPRYIAAIRAIWGIADPPPSSVPLPPSGLVTILPGQQADGELDGVKVTIAVDAQGKYEVETSPPSHFS